MKQIIFVCLGNICRSPMAEMMMEELVEKKNLETEIKVESRSTSTYEIGNSPHPGAIKELRKENVPIIDHQAQQITAADFEKANLVIGMDHQNIVDLKQMAPKKDQFKIHLAYESLGRTDEVQDPWYDHNFQRTYKQLLEILPGWLKQLVKE